MSIRRHDPCPTCGHRKRQTYVCDHCDADMESAAIIVYETMEGDTDTDHYCSLECLQAVHDWTQEGLSESEGYHQIRVMVEGFSALEALAANFPNPAKPAE